ncbi:MULTISPECIES: lateral flagellar capping protein LafB [Aeromonas]|uniref:lateral flagellar capping protein LafB n=1 Tax=Aeromonas TaxID=642 RepID=UPI0005A6D588|nr:lateral flagellar capping protein LafB [Aeromonas enteropelogenes]UBH55392.1 lateral flagellar capping protein LafB [Aeromonas enteropelogenes]UCA11968.1 lateral flagellar capping protein LafB [Aeromonas enteropelogenes]BEE19434.1 lateral flagellar hook-associated protein 2 [Aeromonas enteropelogenes]BEE23597.1 lateral flagellar hook-associated protein 2 [Aeromonas enteropelogenes]
MQIDPAGTAMQLVALERQNMDKLLKKQMDSITGQRKALTALHTKLSSFQTMLKDLNKASNLQAQKGTVSQEGFMKVTSDGTASSGQYNLFVEQLAQAHQVGLSLDSESAQLPATGTLSLEVKGKKLEIDLASLPAGSTVKDLVSEINDAKDNPGVKATLVRSDGKVNLVLTSTETGTENAIAINYSGDAGDMLGTALAGKRDITKAQDAKLQMGGDNPLTIVSASNKVENVIDGLTLELTKAQKPGEAPLQVVVAQDKEAVTGSLKKFVDSYNELVDELAKMTSSDPKSPGALASDSGIRSLKSMLGNSVRDLPNGMTLGSLGIKTDRYGKLSFNETDFNKALEKDPELLGKALLGDDGLLKRMSTDLDPYVKRDGVLKSRNAGLDANEKRVNDRMAALDRKMEAAYKRYLNQFTTMNQMLQSMGAF